MSGKDMKLDELARICAEYPEDDEIFDSSMVRKYREREFFRLNDEICTALGQIHQSARFQSWLVLYQPMRRGRGRMEAILAPEDASAHNGTVCETLMNGVIDFSCDVLDMQTSWAPAPSHVRPLTYDVEHPNGWGTRSYVGTVLLALAKWQSRYDVLVLPRFGIDERTKKSMRGLTDLQKLQYDIPLQGDIDDRDDDPFGRNPKIDLRIPDSFMLDEIDPRFRNPPTQQGGEGDPV